MLKEFVFNTKDGLRYVFILEFLRKQKEGDRVLPKHLFTEELKKGACFEVRVIGFPDVFEKENFKTDKLPDVHIVGRSTYVHPRLIKTDNPSEILFRKGLEDWAKRVIFFFENREKEPTYDLLGVVGKELDYDWKNVLGKDCKIPDHFEKNSELAKRDSQTQSSKSNELHNLYRSFRNIVQGERITSVFVQEI